MFSSTPNANDPNTASLPFHSDLITNSKQDQDLIHPFSLLNFPSPPFSLYTEEDGALFLQSFTDYSLSDTKIDGMEPSKQLLDTNESTNVKKSEHRQGKIITKQLAPRKRSLKKDRHSKINTAQGPRDRRMRLSLEVARKFFDLQDMLGYDKASKTVEWLLTQSKSAIKELSKGFSKTYKLAGERAWESSLVECDAVSGVIGESVDAFNDGDQPEKPEDDSKVPLSGKLRKTSRSQASTRRICCAPLARESRKKARVRARERTREKMLVRKLNVNNGPKPLVISEESGTSQIGHNMKLPSIEVQAKVDELKQIGSITEQVIEDSFTITGNYLQSNGMLQETQIRDFQLFIKPWEAYNGTSYLCANNIAN